MPLHVFGDSNGENLQVSSADISDDLIIFGSGAGDFVEANPGSITNNTIIFGDGAGDFVGALSALPTGPTPNSGSISNNIISFGDGAGDFVGPPPDTASNISGSVSITNNIISFGDGAGDSVSANFGTVNNNIIHFGDGAGDVVEDDGLTGNEGISNNIIVFGNGMGDEVFDPFNLPQTLTNNTIHFGDGAGDSVVYIRGVISYNAIDFGKGDDDYLGSLPILGVDPSLSISNNTITFGDGNNDAVTVYGSSSNNTIRVGNGSNDSITLGTGTPSNGGGDYVATGTGAGDTVAVGLHANPDTFAFALGTSGTNFTTVSGAAALDNVVVNGGYLGNTLSPLSGATTDTTLATYISSLGTLTKGDTYVGFNTTPGEMFTFIVTDTASGQTGAIEITGVAFQHSTLASHVLTLA
jgi:hypothetical protein